MKKSYMNKNNLITEGFFEKLFRKLGISDKEKQKRIKADKKLKTAVSNLNQSNKVQKTKKFSTLYVLQDKYEKIDNKPSTFKKFFEIFRTL